MGTPTYMSPEQALGDTTQVDHATDIYSIGAVMFYCLTGLPPFEGASTWSVVEQVCKQPPPRPSSITPNIPKDLETICLKCLEKKPTQRYQSAYSLLQDLDNYRTKRPLVAKRTTPLGHLVKFCQRHPTTTTISTIATVLCIVAIFLAIKLDFLSKDNFDQRDLNALQAKREQARNQFQEATLLIEAKKHQEAILKLHSTQALAQEAGDHLTNDLALYQINALEQVLWKPRRKLSIPPSTTHFRLSHSGEKLALLGKAGPLQIIETKNGRSLLTSKPDSEITTSAFHPSDEFFLSAHSDGHLTFWKYRNGEFREDGAIEAGPVQHLGFSLDGETFFTAGNNHTIQLWDFSRRLPTRAPLKHHEEVRQTTTAQTVNLIVSLTNSGQIYGWDISTGKRRFGPVKLRAPARTITVNPTGTQLLATFDRGATARIFDLTTCTSRTSFLESSHTVEPTEKLKQAQFSRQSNKLLTLNFDQTFKLRNLPSLAPVNTTLERPQTIEQFRLTNDENLLFFLVPEQQQILVSSPPAHWHNNVEIESFFEAGLISWSVNQPITFPRENYLLIYPPPPLLNADPRRNPPPRYCHLPGKISAVTAYPKENSILALSKQSSSTVFCIDPITRTTTWTIPTEHTHASLIRLNHKGSHLALLTQNAFFDDTINLSVLNLASKEETTFIIPESHLHSLAFSPTHPTQLIISNNSGELIWFDWNQKSIVRRERISSKPILAIDVHPPGNLVAVGGEDFIARVFRESDWKQISPEISHPNSITSIHFISKGHLVASGGNHQSAKIWEIQSGHTIGYPLTHENPISGISACRDPDLILTYTAQGEIKSWPVPN